jgi:large subunit ribosomal protein L5
MPEATAVAKSVPKPAAKPAKPAAKPEAPKAEVRKVPKVPKPPRAPTPPGAPNPMTAPQIAKVTVNIGVGDGGEKLEKAEKVLTKLTGRKPVRTLARENNRELGISPGKPIGCKVTLRGADAEDFVRRALYSRKNRIYEYSFDNQGNLQFGVADYTNFEGERYDPEIGVFGMDVCITLEKPGHRIRHRRLLTRRVPAHHRVSRDEAKAYLTQRFQIEVIG